MCLPTMIVLNMLNTKYFILPNQTQGGEPTFQVNPAALGNAWFVSNIEVVPSANAESDGIENLDPAITALVHQEFQPNLKQTTFDKNGSIKTHLVYVSIILMFLLGVSQKKIMKFYLKTVASDRLAKYEEYFAQEQ